MSVIRHQLVEGVVFFRRMRGGVGISLCGGGGGGVVGGWWVSRVESSGGCGWCCRVWWLWGEAKMRAGVMV